MGILKKAVPYLISGVVGVLMIVLAKKFAPSLTAKLGL